MWGGISKKRLLEGRELKGGIKEGDVKNGGVKQDAVREMFKQEKLKMVGGVKSSGQGWRNLKNVYLWL